MWHQFCWNTVFALSPKHTSKQAPIVEHERARGTKTKAGSACKVFFLGVGTSFNIDTVPFYLTPNDSMTHSFSVSQCTCSSYADHSDSQNDVNKP